MDFKTERKYSVNADKSGVPARALQQHTEKVKSKRKQGLGNERYSGSAERGDYPQLFLSAQLSCPDLLSNQIIQFAASSAHTYSMKSIRAAVWAYQVSALREIAYSTDLSCTFLPRVFINRKRKALPGSFIRALLLVKL